MNVEHGNSGIWPDGLEHYGPAFVGSGDLGSRQAEASNDRVRAGLIAALAGTLVLAVTLLVAKPVVLPMGENAWRVLTAFAAGMLTAGLTYAAYLLTAAALLRARSRKAQSTSASGAWPLTGATAAAMEVAPPPRGILGIPLGTSTGPHGLSRTAVTSGVGARISVMAMAGSESSDKGTGELGGSGQQAGTVTPPTGNDLSPVTGLPLIRPGILQPGPDYPTSGGGGSPFDPNNPADGGRMLLEPGAAPPAREPSKTRRLLIVAGVVLPVVAAGTVTAVLSRGGTNPNLIEVTASSCAAGWTAGAPGARVFTVANNSGHSGDVYLIETTTGGVVHEVESIGPGATQTMQATLGGGSYQWRCTMADQPVRYSTIANVGGGAVAGAPTPVKPVTDKDFEAPLAKYIAYVQPKLTILAGQVNQLHASISGGNLVAAKGQWLAAQLTWQQVGAAYGSFGDLGGAIDGLPNGLPGGVADPDFKGLHKIEYGLWHKATPASLLATTDQLVKDIATLRAKFPKAEFDPADLPLRSHEILEDSLRDHLTGLTDFGSGAAYALTYADAEGTRVVLSELAPLITPRNADLLGTASDQLATLEQVLLATKKNGVWVGPNVTQLAARQKVNAAVGALLETLAPVPDMLEVRTVA